MGLELEGNGSMQRTLFVVALVALTSRGAHAGSVITSNLPANTVIVNVDARQDGASGFDGGQDNWFHPFFTGGATSLLQIAVAPGTYTFQLTNPTLAATQFPSLTTAQKGQMFTAWTYNSPWITDYFVFDSAGVSNPSVPQIFAGAIRPSGLSGGTGSATEAFNFAVTNNYDNVIVKQPGGRVTGVRTTQYTFTSGETLTFAVPDNVLSDNNGGVSVVIRPVANGVAGDYNGNGAVDAADYVRWRDGGPLQNEVSSLGVVDAQDYAAWKARFGNHAGSGASNTGVLGGGAAVPEPTALVLIAIVSIVAAAARARS
jgi:hypothetical protein